MRMLQILLTMMVCLAALSAAYWLGLESAASDGQGEVLRVRTIEIVDDNGIVRARLGSDLPDAVIDGRKIERGGNAAGILLYDSDGQERSGYVTMDPGSNVMLTLDSKRRQVGLLAAGPEGGATVRLWREDDAIELRTDGGGARLSAVKDGELAVQLPEIAMPSDACTAYRQALDRLPIQDVQAACRERFLPVQCNTCIETD